jgi:hypothetical protein
LIKTLIAALIVATVAIGGVASAQSTNPTLNFAWGGVGFA